MRPRQVTRLDGDGADLVRLAAIDSEATLDDEPADLGLLDGLERRPHLALPAVVGAHGGDHLVEHAADGLRPGLLLVGRERRGQLRSRHGPHARLQLGVSGGRLERPAGLAHALHQVLLGAGEPLALRMTVGNRLQHGLFGHLAGARLDHQHGVLGARDYELEARRGPLRGRWIRDEAAVDLAHPDGAHGSLERDPGEAQRGGRAVHRQDVRVVLLVARDGEANDLDFVPEPVGEERTDRPVDEAGGQDLLLDRRAFALEVPARDPAPGIGPLAVLHGEREEILGLSGAASGNTGGEDHRPAVTYDYRTICLLGNRPRLDGERAAIHVDLNSLLHTNACPRGSTGARRTQCESSGTRRRSGAPGLFATEDLLFIARWGR